MKHSCEPSSSYILFHWYSFPRKGRATGLFSDASPALEASRWWKVGKKVKNSLWPQSKQIEMDLCRICEKYTRVHGNERGLVVVTWRGWWVTEFVGRNVVYLCLTQYHTYGCIHIDIPARMDYCPARARSASQFLRHLFVSPHTVFAREGIIVSSNYDFCTDCYFAFCIWKQFSFVFFCFLCVLKTDSPLKIQTLFLNITTENQELRL